MRLSGGGNIAISPIADIRVDAIRGVDAWCDWTALQRLALLTAMLAVAALQWIMLGWLPHEWQAFIGGTAFLLLPQIFGWFLLVGLVTGRMPTRGGSEIRSASPTAFWAIGAAYAALLLLFDGSSFGSPLTLEQTDQ